MTFYYCVCNKCGWGQYKTYIPICCPVCGCEKIEAEKAK